MYAVKYRRQISTVTSYLSYLTGSQLVAADTAKTP